MKKITTILALLTCIASLQAQQITLNFTGKTTANHRQWMDSVTVINHDRNWTETLPYRDTVLKLSVTYGIHELSGLSENSLQNHPNPFEGQTTVRLALPQDGPVNIQIFDINGKVCASLKQTLTAGTHEFAVALAEPQTYLFTVSSEYGNCSHKLINIGTSNGNHIALTSSVTSNGQCPPKYSSQHPFQLGDELEIIGYADNYLSFPLSQEIYDSGTITLTFGAAPCVGAETVTDHEGNVYNTVQIGSQCWTKESMRCTTAPSGGEWLFEPSYGLHYMPCYASPNTTTGGNLYTWAAAMDYPLSENGPFTMNPTFPHQGICPNGWHIPSSADWQELLDNRALSTDCNSSGKDFASQVGWDPHSYNCYVGNQPELNDIAGFSAIPTGTYREHEDTPSEYIYAGQFSYFWSATELGEHASTSYYIMYNDNDISPATSNKYSFFAVRCLKDE